MDGILEIRMKELLSLKERLQSRIQRIDEDIDLLEKIARIATHPIDVCVCQEGACESCTVPEVEGPVGFPPQRVKGRSKRADTDIEDVCKRLAINSLAGDMTVKVGDGVRECKRQGLDRHLSNNSYRSKVHKRLDRSAEWEYLGDATFRFLGRAD